MAYRLCCIRNNIAYFTNKKLNDQWGEYWDVDLAGSCAEAPYCDKPNQIKILMFDACWVDVTSRMSAERLNRKEAPWLTHDDNKLWAGATRKQFVSFIRGAGGTVYAPIYAKKELA